MEKIEAPETIGDIVRIKNYTNMSQYVGYLAKIMEDYGDHWGVQVIDGPNGHTGRCFPFKSTHPNAQCEFFVTEPKVLPIFN